MLFFNIDIAFMERIIKDRPMFRDDLPALHTLLQHKLKQQ